MEGRPEAFKRLLKVLRQCLLPDITPLRLESYRADRKGKIKDSTNQTAKSRRLKGMFSKAVVWGRQRQPPKKLKLIKENKQPDALLEKKGDIAILLPACSVGCGLL